MMRAFLGLLCCLTAAPLVCSAAGSDYFPLQTGNSWVYKQTAGPGSRIGTIEIGQVSVLDGHEYYAVLFFAKSLWIRSVEEKLVVYNPDSKLQSVWIDFSADGTFPTGIDPCVKTAALDRKATAYKGPLGEFSTAVTVVYGTPTCADAGFVSDVFLPYVGLVQHTEQSIAGPVRFELVSSRAGLTEVAASELSFRAALDGQSYAPGSQMIVRMTLKNQTDHAISLKFPSGQDYDIVLRDAKGAEVYRWSSGKAFTQVFRTLDFGPGVRTWADTLTVPDLPAGSYTAEANLATQNPRDFTASVPFQIVATTRP